MLKKSERDCPSFVANDGCDIRELLHPKNDDVDLGFSLAIAEVAVGARTYIHRLAQSEVYFVIAGDGVAHVGDESSSVGVGDAVFIPPGKRQWIENTGDRPLKFAAIVSPPWRAEDDVREPGEG